MKSLFSALITLGLLTACGEKLDPNVSYESAPPPPEAQSETLAALPDGHDPVRGLDILSRGTRRMSISQLERSLDVIGGFPAGTIEFPDDLAVTLGRPDFVLSTEESLEPTPLFMKFMMDLGGFYCLGLWDMEATRADEDKMFTRFADPDETITHLVMRFTGITGTEASPYVERLRTVYDTASAGTLAEAGGWQAVCIALVTSPELLIY